MADRQLIRSARIVDPFGSSPAQTTELAPRRASYDGQTIALFDNGKLDPAFGPFLAVYDAVAAGLRERFPGVQLVRLTVDLLAAGDDPVARALRYLRAHDPAAVVLALADSGVTQRTVELARQLEDQGTPTCLIAAPPGTGLAVAIASAQLPGLPIVDLPVVRTHSRDEVAQATGQRLAEVVDGLTLPVAEQWARFAQHHTSAEPLAALGSDGRLQLDPLEAGAGSAIEPNVWSGGFYDRLSEGGLGDGLPVILPTEDRVAATLATVDRAPGDILLPALIPSGAPVTVEKLAANAVLAGCRPEYFPIVLTAFEAMTDPRYRLLQAAITSHSSGNLLMVSGPLADQLGISGGAGCLGPGHRANATIGRALTLTLINVGRIRPGAADLAGFGSPAEFSYCFAENRAASPWPTFVEERYEPGATCVLVHRCEAPHNVIDHLSVTPEGILTGVAAVAATLGGNNAYQPAELIVLLNPEHVQEIVGAGWSKRDVQLFLWEESRNPAPYLQGRGLPPNRRRSTSLGDWIPVVDDPDDIIVVAAGGPGPQSQVAIPWGFARAVHRRVAG